jgi:hypothetical protein
VKLSDQVTLCLGVGAQKAGTTWLGSYFEKHPSVFMSPIKELHYFDALWIPDRMGKRNRQTLKQLKRATGKITLDEVKDRGANWDLIGQLYDRLEMFGGGHAKYLEFFARRVGDCTVAAEISPSYSLLSTENFREIRGIHSRVKAVFLMRNPIDRVWSALRHRERKGFKIDAGFDKAVTGAGMKLRSDYTHTLEALKAAFPAEDVFVEFYENLFTEPAIQRLCTFLAIPYHPAPFQTYVNKAPERPMAAERRRQVGEVLRPIYEYCHEQFGDRLPELWRTDLKFISQGA